MARIGSTAIILGSSALVLAGCAATTDIRRAGLRGSQPAAERAERGGGQALNRRQYYDQRRKRHYYYDPRRQAYFWEDGAPRT